MNGMNMDRFNTAHQQVSANSGIEFGDIPKLVVVNGLSIRLVGDFSTTWEHFASINSGSRPFFCEGPESDCPLCAASSSLSYSDDPKNQEIGKDLRAKEKFFFNVLDRSPTGRAWHSEHKVAKILTQNDRSTSIGTMLFKAIGDIAAMRQQQGQDPNPNMYDIVLQKSGSGMKTKYGAQFSGNTEPLTPEELEYTLHPIDQLSKITERSSREEAAKYVLSGGGVSQSQATEFNPQSYSAKMPAQTQPTQQYQTQHSSPRPAAQPLQTQPLNIQAGAQPLQTQPMKINIKPPQQDQYQDTTVRSDKDPSTTLIVPCSNCATDMQIDMEDQRDLKCHSCGMIYTHPSKG